jgi:hypothetical protein
MEREKKFKMFRPQVVNSRVVNGLMSTLRTVTCSIFFAPNISFTYSVLYHRLNMSATKLFIIFMALVAQVMAGKKDGGPVTCGSVVKLQHKETVISDQFNSLLFS